MIKLFLEDSLTLQQKSKVAKILNNINESTFLGKLKGILANSIVDNESKMEKLIIDSIRFNPIEILMNTENKIELYVNKEDFKLIIQKLLLKITNVKLFKIYLLYLNEYLTDDYKKELKIDEVVNFSLQDIRKIIKSPTYGVNLICFWMPYFFKRSTFKEASIEFLNLSTKITNLALEQNWWVFSFYTLTNDEFYSKYEVLLDKKQPFKSVVDRYLLLMMQENDDMKKALTSLKLYEKVGLFKIKRKYFLELLEDSETKDFAIFNLFLIGDQQVSYLQ